MITITITDEVLQEQVQKSITEQLTNTSSYSNPVKSLAEKQLSHNGPLRDALKAKISQMITAMIDSPTHDQVIGAVIIQEMAKKQIEEIQKSKRGF